MDWWIPIQWVMQYGDDLMYYENNKEITFKPSRYDNMKKWGKRN